MRLCASEIAAEPDDFLRIFYRFHEKAGIDYLFETDQHYKLLAYIARQYEGARFWDVGTAFGASAIALAQQKTNTVISFDPVPQIHEPIKEKYRNIKWSAKDLLATPHFYYPVVLPDLILLDVDPHDGVWETKFLRWLRRLGFKGFLIMDDIQPTHHPELWKVWLSIPERKYDITHMGHFSGTGLVCFNDEPVEIC